MKTINSLIVVIFLTLILLCTNIGNSPEEVEAGLFKENYAWGHAISITTTAQDSHFVSQWKEISMWSYGCGLLVRYGVPDTTSWSSRDWIRLIEGQVLTFGPATKLTRLEFKAASGSGTIYFVGYKTTAQF
jgi:hypothetical protein